MGAVPWMGRQPIAPNVSRVGCVGFSVCCILAFDALIDVPFFSVPMSSASQHRGSVPPIVALPDGEDGNREQLATDASSGSDRESQLEYEHSTDRASSPAISDVQSARAVSPRTRLIPNPGFLHVRSWRRVPVPAGREEELDVVKVSCMC